MSDKFLPKAYRVGSPDEVKDLYAGWAESYDAETAENGYVTPSRAADALAAHAPDATAPLLDIGCGTGLSGAAFAAAGFSTIDGTDFSEPMLARARTKGCYRALFVTDAADPLPVEEGAYPAMAAVGLFSPAHAPAALIDQVMGKLPRGGRFVFSLNDHALEDPSYVQRINEHLDAGAARCLHREHGEHMTGIGLGATIYVLERI